MDRLHAWTLGNLLREHARSHPQKMALICGDARHNYRELDERVNRLARAWAAQGFEAGDRVLWLGQNCHRLLEALLAAAKLGGVLCPTNWRQSPEELAFVIDDCKPKFVLWQQREIGESVAQARKVSGQQSFWVRIDGEVHEDGSYEALLAAADASDPTRDVDPQSAVLQMYTAAFSGKPQGALLSHTALLLQGLVISKIQDIDADYVYLNSGPLFHVATLMTTLATFVWAGTNVFTPRVDAEELCRLIDAEGCTGGFLMGPTLQQMVEANRDGQYDLSSLRSFPAQPEWNAMTSRDESPWGLRPGGYGQTEVMGLATLAALGADAAGSHGRPTPFVQLRIVDPAGHEVPTGETGEIVVRGPSVMLGYQGNPDANRERQRGDWHHTGDLGRRETDGSISFIAPKTRLIKSAAENIYPSEVEACLRRHPAVADCAVIGVPDPRWDQSVKAVVVVCKGAKLEAEELIEHCRAHIASYKKPRTVEFVDAIPRKGLSIDYEELDTRFGGGGYPGS